MPHDYAQQCKKIATHTNHNQCIILHKTQVPNLSRAIWVRQSDVKERSWSCEWRSRCGGETVIWCISCPAVRGCQFWLLWLAVFNVRIREIRLKRRTFQNHIYIYIVLSQTNETLTDTCRNPEVDENCSSFTYFCTLESAAFLGGVTIKFYSDWQQMITFSLSFIFFLFSRLLPAWLRQPGLRCGFVRTWSWIWDSKKQKTYNDKRVKPLLISTMSHPRVGGVGGRVDRIESYQLRAHGSRSHQRAPRGWQLKGLDHQTNTVKVAIILMGDWDRKRLRNTYLDSAHRQ